MPNPELQPDCVNRPGAAAGCCAYHRTISTHWCNVAAFGPVTGNKHSKRTTLLGTWNVVELNRSGCVFAARSDNHRVFHRHCSQGLKYRLVSLSLKWAEITQETGSIVASYFSEARPSALCIYLLLLGKKLIKVCRFAMSAASSGRACERVCAWDQFAGLCEWSTNKMWNQPCVVVGLSDSRSAVRRFKCGSLCFVCAEISSWLQSPEIAFPRWFSPTHLRRRIQVS